MAITTYITPAEAQLYFSNFADYGTDPTLAVLSDRQTLALTASFGLVNSYISSKLSVPVVGEWDGASTIAAPEPLKMAQAQFCQYLLEFGNVGFTDELDKLHKSIIATLRAITQNELVVNQSEIFDAQVGWHIVSRTNSANGGVEIRGTPPLNKSFYRLVCGSLQTTTQYPSGIRVTGYRSDSATARQTNVTADWYTWQVFDSAFEIRFDGQWATSWEVLVSGVPESAVNSAAPTNVLKQSDIAYNSTAQCGERFR